MFSLIITLISIALVAALALASLYYGGPVFNQGAARAHAAKIAAQGQQIQGAAELYKADTGEYPISLAELVTKDYLKSIPVAAAQEQVLINNALAASSWVMVAPKTPVFALTGVTEAVCKAVNLGSYGVEGILKTARESNRVQCYGTDVGSLMIVQAKAPSDLVAASTNPAAVISVGTVLAAPVPAADSTDTSNAGWLVAPGSGTPVVTPPAAPQISFEDGKAAALSTLAFPDTLVGQVAAAQSVVVRNTGNASITFTAQGASVPSPYSEVVDGCASATLAPNESCTVSVVFTPIAATSYSGASYSLTLSSSNATVAITAGLSGTGLLPTYYPNMFKYVVSTNEVFKQSVDQRVINPYNDYASGSGYQWLDSGFHPSTATGSLVQLVFWVDYIDTAIPERAIANGLAANALDLGASSEPCFTYDGYQTTAVNCPGNAAFPVLASKNPPTLN